MDSKNAASTREANWPLHAVVKEAVGGGKGRMSAEIDLDRRREPAETEIGVG